MSYRTILLELADEASSEARISAGLALASKFQARLTGMRVMPPPIVPVGYGEGAAFVGPEILEAQRKAEQEITAKIKAKWDALTAGAANVVWHAEEGEPYDRLGVYARTSDLTITARADVSGIDALPPQMVEDLLHVVGGPLLMLPPTLTATIGTKPLVAWNGGREAARAVKDAMPFLEKAEQVTLLAIGEEPGDTVEAAKTQLEAHGCKIRAIHIEAEDDIGKQLLASVSSEQCDLLVMGAYGHSRLRELMLGGATRYVVRNAPTAVLFSG